MEGQRYACWPGNGRWYGMGVDSVDQPMIYSSISDVPGAGGENWVTG